MWLWLFFPQWQVIHGSPFAQQLVPIVEQVSAETWSWNVCKFWFWLCLDKQIQTALKQDDEMWWNDWRLVGSQGQTGSIIAVASAKSSAGSGWPPLAAPPGHARFKCTDAPCSIQNSSMWNSTVAVVHEIRTNQPKTNQKSTKTQKENNNYTSIDPR